MSKKIMLPGNVKKSTITTYLLAIFLGILVVFIVVWTYWLYYALNQRIDKEKQAYFSEVTGKIEESIDITEEDKFLDLLLIYFKIVSFVVIVMFFIAIFYVSKINVERKIGRKKDELNVRLVKKAESSNQTSQAKSEFLSNMSHDIRTPINGIMGTTLIAKRNIEDREKVCECLDKIDISSQYLLALVNDVLDMSLIESGEVKVSCEPFNINQLLHTCTSIIIGQLQNKGIRFDQEFDCFSQPNLMGDEPHLRQIFIKILGNAVKFTPDGGSIVFRAWEEGATTEKVNFVFEVEDTGMGMNPEFLGHIWEPFAKDKNKAWPGYRGTGLGMAVTKQFIDLMGGTISVDSELGKGSCFTVRLAFRVNKNVLNKKEQEINVIGMRILLVEDNELNMEIATELLKDEGIEVVQAENGEVAVHLFENVAPGYYDAILMDVMMPVMDGLTATKTIRSMARQDAGIIPILAMTANAFEDDIKATKDAGMDNYFSKPIDIKLILKFLSQYRKKSENK